MLLPILTTTLQEKTNLSSNAFSPYQPRDGKARTSSRRRDFVEENAPSVLLPTTKTRRHNTIGSFGPLCLCGANETDRFYIPQKRMRFNVFPGEARIRLTSVAVLLPTTKTRRGKSIRSFGPLCLCGARAQDASPHSWRLAGGTTGRQLNPWSQEA